MPTHDEVVAQTDATTFRDNLADAWANDPNLRPANVTLEDQRSAATSDLSLGSWTPPTNPTAADERQSGAF